MPDITDQEFSRFREFIYAAAGISFSEGKKALVGGRLAERVRRLRCRSYGEYFGLLSGGGAPEEVQTAIDLLTTNETYFFREPRHFDFLRTQVRLEAKRGTALRVWSAAGSTGEEAYSVCMVLEDLLPGQGWEVLASDISARVLERARRGHYPMARARNVPESYLRRFCLKGEGKQAQTLLVKRELRRRVQFLQVNLDATLPPLGSFDFVFLRNVLIYFNLETKRRVVERVLSVLKRGGWLLIGHSESLNDVSEAVQSIAPAIYRKT